MSLTQDDLNRIDALMQNQLKDQLRPINKKLDCLIVASNPDAAMLMKGVPVVEKKVDAVVVADTKSAIHSPEQVS